MKPVVTVIMPCYNAEKYIADAVNSILCQTYEQFELIIIDDGSTDRSLMYIYDLKEKDKRIKVIKNETNRGISYSRNRGLKESEGEYIALMDADDIAYPNRLADQVSALEKNREIDAISGYYDILTGKSKRENISVLYEYGAKEVAIRLMFRCIIADSSTMCRKSVLIKNNITFPENYRAVGGYKFWCEFALYGSIIVLPQKYYQYRINDEGLTQLTKRQNSEERYEWHNKIHDFYWNAQGMELANQEKKVLYDATNGRHIEAVRLFQLRKVLKKICSQFSKVHTKTECMYLKKICRELMWGEIAEICSKGYHRVRKK